MASWASGVISVGVRAGTAVTAAGGWPGFSAGCAAASMLPNAANTTAPQSTADPA